MINKIVFLALFIPSILSYEETIPSLVLIREDIECMAKNIYHEARGEPAKGIDAIIEVTHNRTKKSTCETVYKYKQFSWTIKDKHKKIPSEDLEYYKKWVIDWYANPTNYTQGSTFYHTSSVKPKWRKKLKRETQIGNHIFYSKGS